MTITFEQAKELLSKSYTCHLRDHAFGDSELYWENEAGETVASGYSGGGMTEVCVGETKFEGKEAEALELLGQFRSVSRNDSTGPDTYQKGVCMPGLTNEGVLDELSKTHCK